MMKFPRPAQPNFLRENYKAWGREYKTKRDAQSSPAFQWKYHLGQRVNTLILLAFGTLAEHCAFCDGYPLGPFARPTIEHFRPASRFPRLTYVWHNLFPACDRCQSSKRERFDRGLLKPDVDEYSFDQYFIMNYRTGDIMVNPLASSYDQHRA